MVATSDLWIATVDSLKDILGYSFSEFVFKCEGFVAYVVVDSMIAFLTPEAFTLSAIT